MGEALSRSTIYAYGSLGLPLAVVGYPLAVWIPAHYSGGLGISLAAVGAILMIARLGDVLTDPIVGELSDRWHTRFGRRKPWVVAGTLAMLLGIYNLFMPHADAGLVTFLVWLTVLFIGSTMIAVPHRAWGAELSPDYHQRSRVSAGREVFTLVGLTVAATVPLMIEVLSLGGTLREVAAVLWDETLAVLSGELSTRVPMNRSALTGPVLEGLAWTIIVVLPVCAAIVVAVVREPEQRLVVGRRPSVREGLRLVVRNGPMMRVLCIAVLVYFGEAARSAISLFFIRDVVGVPAIGAAYFLYFTAGLCAIPFWLWLGRTIGKHRAFMTTLIIVASVSLGNLLLERGDYFPFFVLFIIKGFCFGGTHFLPLAMLADVVDVDTIRSNASRAGTYFAFYGFSEKLAIAFGTGASLNLIAMLGFDPSAVDGVSGDQGLMALRLVYCLGPVVFYGLAMRLVWSYPLTPARHARLRARIDRRTLRLAQTNG